MSDKVDKALVMAILKDIEDKLRFIEGEDDELEEMPEHCPCWVLDAHNRAFVAVLGARMMLEFHDDGSGDYAESRRDAE